MRSKWLRIFSKSRCGERILIYWAQDEIMRKVIMADEERLFHKI